MIMLNQDKKRILVIFGGRSGEHEVSLMSARSVLSALDSDKYTVIQVGITHDGVWMVGEDILDAFESSDYLSHKTATLLPDPTRRDLYLIENTENGEVLLRFSKIDVVFPVLHGTFGEDGTLQGLLELTEAAYVGAGVLGSSLAMDKGVFKDVMLANNIPVLDSMVVSRKQIEQDSSKVIDSIEQILEYPIFVKPANMGSSVGITKCWSRSDLIEGLFEAALFDRRVLIEKGFEAREIEVSVLGNEEAVASVPGEIIPSREFYSYEAKYIDDNSELIIPAPMSEGLSLKVRELAVQAYKAIDCAGMARVDFLLGKKIAGQGEQTGLFLNEINTIPGFTKISMYPKLWEASGISYPELLDRLIMLALERKEERIQTERRYRRDD
jgi:D-alanine-D-alanine ligase